MKRLLVAIQVLVCIAGYAQPAELPREVDSAFKTKYTGSRMAGWWEENELYYIDFILQGGSFIAVFDPQGSWKETAETISELEIPAEIRSYIRSNFPSGTISFCELVEAPGIPKYLRVNVIDAGNVLRIIRSDRDGKNISVQETKP
jgi:hypothetical protein